MRAAQQARLHPVLQEKRKSADAAGGTFGGDRGGCDALVVFSGCGHLWLRVNGTDKLARAFTVVHVLLFGRQRKKYGKNLQASSGPGTGGRFSGRRYKLILAKHETS